uniref:ATP-dependent DNA helicase n=1 Tax=viral metagenome TaxID=1070528 RepID=A0A6C0DYM9_9ZZZZ
MDAYESTQIETDQYKTTMGVLKKYFGYDTLKENQYKIIHNILNCKDVIALLPTSHGKSLCFQIIPLITNEVCIVISPLISLMEDQKMILDKLNINSCCYNGTSNAKQKEEIEKDVLDNKYRIIYTTPETLINSKNFIEKIFRKIGICVLAIDESHCVSSFGYDFRPAYRSIIDIKKLLKGVPVLALTATATKDVIEDIKTELKIKKCEIIRSSFNRTNLKINVREQTKETKDKIVSIIENISVGSVIIYCVTRKDTEKMTEFLKENKIKSVCYHGGMSNKDRTTTQDKFMSSKVKCICATNSFGMGINKADVRVIIHYGLPQNIEGYYQEIGRGGRDGEKAECFLFYAKKDFITQNFLIKQTQDEEYKKVKQTLFMIISRYVETLQCRKKYILNYFGECIDKCNNCDNCLKNKKRQDSQDSQDESQDENQDERKKPEIMTQNDNQMLYNLLSLMKEIYEVKNHWFGQSKLIDMLKGSSKAGIEPWMKKLLMFGSMKNITIEKLKVLVDKAKNNEYIEMEAIKFFIVVKISDKGYDFLTTVNQ